MIERIKKIGTRLTFDGEYIADFLTRLSKLLDIKSIELEKDTVNVYVGQPIEASQEDILKIITKSTLLNVTAAGFEDTHKGKKLYFEWYIPIGEEIY
jgi:hypothetical protein